MRFGGKEAREMAQQLGVYTVLLKESQFFHIFQCICLWKIILTVNAMRSRTTWERGFWEHLRWIVLITSLMWKDTPTVVSTIPWTVNPVYEWRKKKSQHLYMHYSLLAVELRDGEKAQWIIACWVNMEIWVQIPKLHIEPGGVICICNHNILIGIWWERIWRQENHCVMAKVVLAGRNKRPCFKPGKRWEMTLRLFSENICTCMHTHVHTCVNPPT